MGAMETDCEKCLHQKVCALWRAHESQDASCFSLDGCDYFDATLTPPNEWVNRVRELDELYTKLQIVTGFTAEQLLEIFAAGYTLEKPDYSKKFAEMENLAEAAQPNEPLTMEELREMDGEAIYWPKNKMWLIVYLNHPDFGDCAVNRYGQYLKLENCEKRKVYRRPPEGEADA